MPGSMREAPKTIRVAPCGFSQGPASSLAYQETNGVTVTTVTTSPKPAKNFNSHGSKHFSHIPGACTLCPTFMAVAYQEPGPFVPGTRAVALVAKVQAGSTVRI